MMNTGLVDNNINHSESIVKPDAYINILINELTAAGEMLYIDAGRAISHYHLGERQCFLLHKGSVMLFRGTDGMVLNSERAPFIFGLTSQMADADNLFIKTQEKSVITRLQLNQANEIIQEKALWEDFAHLLVYTSSRIYEHCKTITQLTSYDIVRAQLMELAKENSEIRENTSIISYIMSRTFLSRSGVLAILAQLKSGGYVQIKNGILIDIKELPLKY